MSREHGLERAGWRQPLKPPQKHGDMSWGGSEPGQDSRVQGKEAGLGGRGRKKTVLGGASGVSWGPGEGGTNFLLLWVGGGRWSHKQAACTG